jgi:hypothetical protein
MVVSFTEEPTQRCRSPVPSTSVGLLAIKLSPEMIKLNPKADARATVRERKRGKSRISIDSLEKLKIEQKRWRKSEKEHCLESK